MRARGVLLAALAILAIASPARAQTPPPDVERGPWSGAPLPPYAPKTLAFEEGMPIPPGYQIEMQRRRPLIIAGAALFGASWVASVLTASTVVLGYDKHRAEVAPLFIPFAGPFVTLGMSRDAQLNDPATRVNGVLLLLDGAAQLTGAALFIAGMVTREPVLVRTPRSYAPQISAAPEVIFAGRAAALRWSF
jgi:hypothetical protein